MDCLVTKLKGTVNDSSLPELGCLYFTLQNTSENLVKIEAIGEGVEFFTPDKETVFYSSSSKEGSGASKYAVSTSNTIFFVDASKKVRIGVRNKYALEKFDVYVNNDKTLTMEVDFNDLAYCKKLNRLALTYMNLSGDISALQDLTALTSFNAYDGADYTGDFFGMLASKDWENFQCNGDFSYTTKNYRGRTYTHVGSRRCKCNNLDAFLNDFQNVNSTTRGELIMTGSRTSVSDAAVSALQGKGFTVSITPA